MKKQFGVFKSRIRVFLACGFYLAAWIVPVGLRRNYSGNTRVLVFHHVDDAARFRSIIRSLKERYSLISFAQYLRDEKARDRINIIIALDDGYRSWYRAALPVFKEFDVRPLLFVDSDFVGKDEAKAMDHCRAAITTWPEPSLNWGELKVLHSIGAEIGGHTAGHVDLVACANVGCVRECIANDRAAISRSLGQDIRSFAYPFGRYDDQAVEAVRKAGYSYAFTSDSGFLEESGGRYLLKRSNIGLRPALVVCAMVEGWADRVSTVVRFLKGRPKDSCAGG